MNDVAGHRDNGNHVFVWSDVVASSERYLSRCDDQSVVGSPLHSRFLRTRLYRRHTAPMDLGIGIRIHWNHLVTCDCIEPEEREERKR